MTKISPGQHVMTLHYIDLNGFGRAGSCRECTSSRSDETSTPKRWIRGDTKIGPVLQVKVTYRLYKCGIEIGVTSLKKADLNRGL